MENDNAKNDNAQSPEELEPTRAPVQANPKTDRTKESKAKSRKGKKWSLREHWKHASRRTQVKWCAEGLVIATGVAVLGTYIWQNLQTKWNFAEEHRPKVIISRPPELLGTFDCYITDKAIHIHTGPMHVYVKNIHGGDASGAFIEPPALKLVPNIKVGEPFFDDPPTIDGATCKPEVATEMKAFPVRSGEEVVVNIKQGAGTISLIKTHSVTTAFAGPQT